VTSNEDTANGTAHSPVCLPDCTGEKQRGHGEWLGGYQFLVQDLVGQRQIL